MISVSTTKTGSNWLDRLRTSRGFPTGYEPGLDRFLSSSSSSGSAPSESSTRPGLVLRKTAVEFAGDVSDILSDLFNMGECSRSFSKPKNGRKQSNPKPFSAKNIGGDTNNSISNNNKELCSSDDLKRDRSENGALVSSGDNSLNNNNDNGRVCVPVVVVDGADDIDLKAYAKREVTVIDTSFADWKSEKWVFRKNDEWKIRDKCKPIGKKKRKFDDDDDDDHMKLKNKEVGGVANEKVKVKEKNVLHLNKELYSNDKEGGLPKELGDFVWKVPQNRFPCPRPPEKSKPEVSPVIIFKSNPPSSSNGAIKQGRKSALKKPPKRMKII